ncbi:hypothetical protein NL364_30970, partial [Klebsiella pneumoniae]|nr:hypothetical protein [Klebsiella pneumoniae]
GFDTLIAFGSVTSSGDAAIKLDRAFLIEARQYARPTAINSGVGDPAPGLTPVLSTGGALSIAAPYIGLRGMVDRAVPAGG